MCVMSRGRWSDVRSCTALQEVGKAISGEAKEMLGKVCLVLDSKGLRIGLSELLWTLCQQSGVILRHCRRLQTI